MKEYYDQRQHISLSQLAFDIIEQDKYEFMTQPSRQGLINLIIEAFADKSNADIDKAVIRYKEKLSGDLAQIPESKTKADIISTLSKKYRNELLQKILDYPRDQSFKFQLNEHNFAAKERWDENGFYGSHPGRFYKAVLEEYARKSYYEREEIVLGKLISELELHITASKLIIIKMQGMPDRRKEVRPYAITHDPLFNFHYLVGYSREYGSSYPEKIVSYRISRIETVRSSSSRSGRITKEQGSVIERRLNTVGVQFLLQDADKIEVRLTAQGKRNYESQVHLRPHYISCREEQDGSWIYSFDCSQMQAEFYFFKFGADAEILSPAPLRNTFLSKYKEALMTYGN